MDTDQAQTYRNAMEDLVNEEIEHQLKRLPAKLKQFIAIAEVAAYALNRLPSLYATSEKGWRQQRMRGKQELSTQITTIVRQALAAIQHDPLRVSTPLHFRADDSQINALQELRYILVQDDLTWENAIDAVEQALTKTARGEVTWRRRPNPDSQDSKWDHDDRYV
jgi:hypothetical protein